MLEVKIIRNNNEFYLKVKKYKIDKDFSKSLLPFMNKIYYNFIFYLTDNKNKIIEIDEQKFIYDKLPTEDMKYIKNSNEFLWYFNGNYKLKNKIEIPEEIKKIYNILNNSEKDYYNFLYDYFVNKLFDINKTKILYNKDEMKNYYLL